MSIHAAYNHSLLIGCYDVAANAKTVSYGASCTANDATTLNTTDLWQVLIGGLKSWKIDIAGLQDYAVASVDEVLWQSGAFSNPIPMSSTPEGPSDGSLAYFGKLMPTSYAPFGGNVGDIGAVKLAGVGSKYPLVRGQVLHPAATTRTASGTGTQQSLGAVSATQAVYVNLHVLAASGTTPSLTVKVQSAATADSSFASPTDRVTLTAATDLTNPQFAFTLGAITDTRWRVAWTISGTSPSFNFAATVGIAAP